jgi:hypothetical protein
MWAGVLLPQQTRINDDLVVLSITALAEYLAVVELVEIGFFVLGPKAPPLRRGGKRRNGRRPRKTQANKIVKDRREQTIEETFG